MAKTRSETIKLIGNPQRKEDRAVAAVKPGHLVEFNGVGIRKHSVAKGNARKAIVFENELLGKTIDDEYAIGENCYYGVMEPGSEAQVRLAANAAAIVKGDFLESAGDGTFRKRTAFVADPVAEGGVALAVATEAIDNSANATEVFINVEFL